MTMLTIQKASIGIVLSTALVACGGGSDNSSGFRETIYQWEGTPSFKPLAQPVSYPTPADTDNMFGKEVASVYGGEYQLVCKLPDNQQPTEPSSFTEKNEIYTIKTTQKTLTVDEEGRFYLDGTLLFDNERSGSLKIQNNIDSDFDHVFVSDFTHDTMTSLAITKTLDDFPNVEIAYKDETSEQCRIKLNKPKYFSENLGQFLRNRMANQNNQTVSCAKRGDDHHIFNFIPDVSDFLPEKQSVNLLTDNSVRIADTTFNSKKYENPHFDLGSSATDDMSWAYHFTVSSKDVLSFEDTLNLNFDTNNMINYAHLNDKDADTGYYICQR